VHARQKLRLLAEAIGALSGVFFFDYSGVEVAWRLLLMAGVQNGATEAFENRRTWDWFQTVPSGQRETDPDGPSLFGGGQ
jgi:hypothetical protein